MKVILLDDIPKLGRRGEVRDVAEGYARNYLLPHRLVLPASPQNLKQIEQIKEHQEIRSQRAKAEAEEVAKRIETLSIAEARQAETLEHPIPKELRGIGVPIKALGEYTVPIRLHHEVTAYLKVNVSRG